MASEFRMYWNLSWISRLKDYDACSQGINQINSLLVNQDKCGLVFPDFIVFELDSYIYARSDFYCSYICSFSYARFWNLGFLWVATPFLFDHIHHQARPPSLSTHYYLPVNLIQFACWIVIYIWYSYILHGFKSSDS